MSVLEVSTLDASYGKINALRGVSIRVDEGERVVLLGANGAGKTTTLDCISGSGGARTTGKIEMGGVSIAHLPAHERVARGVVHVPEGRGIFTAMTVMENLELGGFILGASSAGQLKDALARVLSIFPRLEERRNQRAGTMSGGEQQMLAIARGLMSSPKLIMLDEPSTGLSPAMIGQVFDALARISDEGVSVLLVEQKVEAALAFASQAYVLSRGRVVLAGSAAEVAQDRGLKEAYLGLSTKGEAEDGVR